MTIEISFLRRPEVIRRVGYGRETLATRVKDGLFPPSIPLGKRAVGWVAHEVNEVLYAMASNKTDDEIRALVVDLVNRRGTE